jgi:acetyltransferase-like isoleucine patch superfamily enzyme
MLLRVFKSLIKHPRFFKQYGKKVKISFFTCIDFPEKVSISDYVSIGSGGKLFADGGISIGSNTVISCDFLCLTNNHNCDSPDLKSIPYDDRVVRKPVIIGKSVWIRANVTVVPGVKIDDNSVVGMGSVVTKDVEPYSVVGGNPAKSIRHRKNIEVYKKIEQKEAFYLKKVLNN